ncbi:MAG: sulfurtransferase TusA family protein [Alphaproteobacteria bacterium]|nr:sulfurtransferase TusA family protein [Alphaproteobacteria bacterium]
MEKGNSAWTAAEVLDLTGLKCPLPSLMTEKALRSMAPGAVVAVTVTDPMAPLDLRHLCQKLGHSFVAERAGDGAGRQILIRRGPA